MGGGVTLHRGMGNELPAVVPILLLAWTSPTAAGQGSAPAAPAAGLTSEVGFYAGLALAPPEIGRDVNRAGGDTLVAGLGDSPVFGGRFEMHRRYVGGAFNLLVWGKSVAVTNEAGVEFPNHGEPPLLYTLEARLYPLGESPVARVSPYLAAGVGGALISVDLDNVDDQELRHLWAYSLGGGLKISFNEGKTFVDLQFTSSSLSGSGPIVPFRVYTVMVGFGARY
jgi:opacity protein-like surface antigen